MTQNLPTLPLHYLMRPASPGDGKPPLLLLLHGVGSNERDLFGLAPYLDERFLIVSARAPITLNYGGYGWYPVQFTPSGFHIDAKLLLDSQKVLMRFIQAAVEAFDADPQRVYLMGFSQGAIMSLNTMLTQPEAISGVVAMSGRLIDDLRETWAAPERLDGFPVLVVHGIRDEVITIDMGRAVRDDLATLPLKLTYREYPMGHQISDASLRDIIAWLDEQLSTHE